MTSSPWLAFDATKSPDRLERELRRAWEGFLAEAEASAVRAPIAASWLRSQQAGVDPLVARVAPVVAEADEAAARWDVHRLASASALIRECLQALEAEQLIVVSDADGTLLWVAGEHQLRQRAAESLNFFEGAAWSEAGAGTNAIGTALAAEHSIQVFGSEHFNSGVQAWVCSASPVRDPDTDRVIGVIDLTGPVNAALPHTFAAAHATARAVEAQLRADMYERDARLRARYEEGNPDQRQQALVTQTGRVIAPGSDGWLGVSRLDIPPGGGEILLPSGVRVLVEPTRRGDGYIAHRPDGDGSRPRRPVLRLRLLEMRASVERDGDPIALSPRHCEILALLTLRPDGMTSEALACDLYGDEGRPATVRVEMSRLRKALGGGIDTDPYRLAMNLDSDVARVRGHLAQGDVRAAADCYAGPLLRYSEAPGVVRDRDELERWLRHAVMTVGGVEALWAWVHCPSGQDDLPAWKRLVSALPFEDPRRTLAAATLQSLREALGSSAGG